MNINLWFNHVSVKIYCFQVSAAVNYNLIYDSSSSVNLERCLTLEQHEWRIAKLHTYIHIYLKRSHISWRNNKKDYSKGVSGIKYDEFITKAKLVGKIAEFTALLNILAAMEMFYCELEYSYEIIKGRTCFRIEEINYIWKKNPFNSRLCVCKLCFCSLTIALSQRSWCVTLTWAQVKFSTC